MTAKMDIREELKSAGVYPSGPCSGYPRERNRELLLRAEEERQGRKITEQNFYDKKGRLIRTVPTDNPQAKVTAGKMASGLLKTAGQALTNGKVSKEIRTERYKTCKVCPMFDPASKRCTDCGCFMEAKTWVGGDPDNLCPQKKWKR